MKTIIQHQNYGEITYEESFWTGKKNLSVGGEALTKISKKEFLTSSDEHWTLKGNYLSGVVLNTGSEEIRLTPPRFKMVRNSIICSAFYTDYGVGTALLYFR